MHLTSVLPVLAVLPGENLNHTSTLCSVDLRSLYFVPMDDLGCPPEGYAGDFFRYPGTLPH